MHGSSIDALHDTLHELPHGPLWVAYSGGLDSTTLLHALATRCAGAGRELRAVHVHHGLAAHADDWAAHCQATCDALGVALRVMRVRVDVHAGLGIEGAAREARRAAFAAVLRPGEVLALAHHRDDQAETFLMRALRGSGVDGLAAMRAWTPLGSGRAWRPWLMVPRAAIEAQARMRGLRWIDDASNADARFDRNHLRHHVLPALLARWPHAHGALAQAAAHCAQAVDLLDDDDARALAAARTLDDAVLQLPPLRALTAARRARVLRRWIADRRLPPLPRHGHEAIDALLVGRDDAGSSFEWHGARVQGWNDLLHAAPIAAPLDPGWQATWDGVAPLPLPGGGSLSLIGSAAAAGGFDAPLQVRARRGGERITLPGRTHSHALKHVLQDLQVPPWVRARMPLLVDADGLVLAAADLAYSSAFDARLRALGARLQWNAD